MLMLTIDRADRAPVYEQIRRRIVAMVDRGALAPGDRLPPTRLLAQKLGVHRSTVVRAYEELWALGYLESRAGSYSTVRRRARPVATTNVPEVATSTAPAPAKPPTAVRWKTAGSSRVTRALEDAAQLAARRRPPNSAVDFTRLTADMTLSPQEELRWCFRSVLIRQGREVMDYGDAHGYLPLRETIAMRMRAHGVSVLAEEILVTNGAQHALDLALRLLTRAGDAIAVESPSYACALSLFRLQELNLREIPMRHDGMDLDALETALRRGSPKLVYTIPNFHNPTGITTDQAHRERLLGLCERHRVPLVEDGFEEEMKYFGLAVLPIKSMDERGTVLYLGTFSKVVFPGLRIGWIAAPREAVERLYAIQRVSSLCGNIVAQAVAARFCSSGYYETFLRRIHKVYRGRMQAMLQGLREHLPKGVEWTEPAGGYTLWIGLPGVTMKEEEICARLLRDGVQVSPGSVFLPRRAAHPHFRLSIACTGEAEIAEGCRRLGRSLATMLGG